MHYQWRIALLCLLAVVPAVAENAQPSDDPGAVTPCKSKKKAGDDLCYMEETQSTSFGEVRIRGGEAHLEVEKLNWVRYRYELERKFEATPEIDPLVLFPNIPRTIQVKSEEPKLLDVAAELRSLEDCQANVDTAAVFNDCAKSLLANANARVSAIKTALEKAKTASDTAREMIEQSSSETAKADLVNAATAVKTSRNPVDVEPSDLLPEVQNYLTQRGLSISGVELGLRDLLTAKAKLTEMEALDKAYVAAQTHLENLDKLLATSISKVGQSLTAVESCSFANPGRATYTLVRTDVLAAKGEEGSSEKPKKKEIVVYVCEPLISVSAGVSFATLKERTFQFIAPPSDPSSATAALSIAGAMQTTPGGMGDDNTAANPNVIAFDRESDFRVVPMALSHIRLWQGATWGVHATLGAGVETVGEGVDIEFLAGPSFSIAKRFFITTGVQIGRVDSLIDGYQIGTPQPTGVSKPPVQRSYKPGFGVALSWSFTPAGGSGEAAKEKK